MGQAFRYTWCAVRPRERGLVLSHNSAGGSERAPRRLRKGRPVCDGVVDDETMGAWMMGRAHSLSCRSRPSLSRQDDLRLHHRVGAHHGRWPFGVGADARAALRVLAQWFRFPVTAFQEAVSALARIRS